ncbi:DUF4836 family protein [Winogradskyella flava]|uniref:DUF4836 family protein n=1 Tax=Winogradskyella flava TaxID=1884876 RepID=UPI00249233E7|nr:DUF4836 family protein [Winogradskyella flava]
MKKYLKISLSILLLLLIGYFGYKHFKKTTILLDVIHEDAESVIKIGVHDITKTLILDALWSPSYYWKKTGSYKKDKKKDSLKGDDKGVDLKPFSIVFYTIKAVENTLFTTFKIDDTEAFENYINKYSKKKSITILADSKGYKHLSLGKSKLILAWNTEKLAVALTSGTSIEKLKTVFEDVLLHNKLISDKNNDIIKKLSAASDHITFARKESLIGLNFKDGQAIIDGTIHTEIPNTFKTNITHNRLPEASLQMYFDANFDKQENNNILSRRLKDLSFFTKNNLEVKELVDRTNGFLSITIRGTTKQADTIVSYEYDDNFEKVAVKTLEEKKVPKVSMHIGTNDNESLEEYLTTQGAIKNNILTSIPYYTFYAEENSNGILFNTTKETTVTEEKNSSSFFRLETSFDGLQDDMSIPGANDIFSLLNTLEIEANQVEGTNQIEIQGKLSAKQEDINIIPQIFFGLQQKKADIFWDKEDL